MAAEATIIYYKSGTTSGDCTSPHGNPATGPGLVAGNPVASPGPVADSYIVWFDDVTGLGQNATLDQIIAGPAPWFLFADSGLTTPVPDGWYSNNRFDTSASTNATVYEVRSGEIDNSSTYQCTYAPQTVFSIPVYFVSPVTQPETGEYCAIGKAGILYYEGSIQYTTIEQVIYNSLNQDTPGKLAIWQIGGIGTGEPDPAGIANLDNPINENLDYLDAGEYGDSVHKFYFLQQFDHFNPGSAVWLMDSGAGHAAGSPVPVFPNDPDTVPSQWTPFTCTYGSAIQIDLKYGDSAEKLCSQTNDETYYYWPVPGFSGSSLEDIIAYDPFFRLFKTAADAFTNYINPTNITGIIDAGAYTGDLTPTTGYLWSGVSGGWLTTPFSCALVGQLTPRSIDILVADCDGVGENTSFCHYTTKSVTVWYMAAVDLTLLQIAQLGILLYNNEIGAKNGNPAEIIDYRFIGSQSFTSGRYLIFAPSNIWLGNDSSGNITPISSNIDSPIACTSLPTRPSEHSTKTLDAGGNSVFYAFYKCNTIGMSGTWPVFIVDGDHFVGDSSYISDFIQDLENYSKPVFSTGGGCDCVKYVHEIYTNTDDEAKLLLENFYSTVEIKDPIEIGIVSESTISLYDDCVDCDSDSNETTYTFPFFEQPAVITPGPNLDTEANYKIDNVSIPLLRTNPKLSTNVKLVVDSTDSMYLDSINATQGLSSSNYKKWPLSKESRYAYDLARYYFENNTPIESTFETKRNYSDFSVLDGYDKQFEEDYHYGSKINKSKLYSEEYRITAPIWLDVNVPQKFVVYRVEDPTPELNYSTNAADRLERVTKMMKNSKIVKVFDLSKKTAVGTYLRNHVQDEFFPKSPLSITMEKDEKSTFNGIDLIKGGFVNKTEYIYNDFVQKDQTMIDANDFITDGFRRNKVACANLINLEFMFDDDLAEDYSVNRYFGLYVDDVESGVGEVSFVNKGVVKFKSIDSHLSGDPTFAIPEFNLISNSAVLAYANIRDKFYNLDATKQYNASRYEVAVNASDAEINEMLGINQKGTSVRVTPNEASEGDFIKLKIVDTPTTGEEIRVTKVKKEAVRFKIITNVDLETVRIEDSLGNYVDFTMGATASDSWANLESVWNSIDSLSPQNTQDFYERYDLSVEATLQIDSVVFRERSSNLIDNGLFVTTTSSIIGAKEIYTNVQQDIGSFIADDTTSLNPGQFTNGTFSSRGNFNNIAFAIAGAIRNHTEFDAFSVNEYVYIISNVSGYRLMNSTVLLEAGSLFIESDNLDSLNQLEISQDLLANYRAFNFNGGNSAGKSVLIDKNTADIVKKGEYLPTNHRGKYNLILDIVDWANQNGNSDFVKLIMKDKSTLSSGDYDVYTNSAMALGMFSAYDIHDLNFDFYDTSNSELKELEFETSSKIGYEPFDENQDTAASAGATSALGPVGPSPAPATASNSPEDNIYVIDNQGDVIDGEFAETPSTYFGNLLPGLELENNTNTNPVKILSEYDRLKENSLKEYSTNSRVVPNINKWVLKDTVTVREEPYYLNTNEAFNRTNFAPDLTVEGRDPKSFTHEWFYLESWPEYFTQEMYEKGFSYVNYADGQVIDRNLFTDIDNNHFDLLMVGEGYDVPVDVLDSLGVYDRTEIVFSKTSRSKKYSIIGDGSSSSFADVIFKGIKFKFKKKKNSSVDNNEFVMDSSFNGYKFTTLVKFNGNSDINRVDYEFVKNDKFKFVVFYITLNLEDQFVTDWINRKLMYELKHKIVKYTDGTSTKYKYSDVSIDGAINVSNTSWGPGNEPYIVTGILNNDGSSPAFDQQISSTGSGTFGSIKIEYSFGDYYLDVVRVIGVDKIQVGGAPYYIDSSNNRQTVNTYAIPIAEQKNATYTYLGGGVNAHSLILGFLSANKVSNLLDTSIGEFKFTTVNEDGTEDNGKYVVSMEDGNEVIKTSNLVYSIDTETPKAYKLKKDAIGHVIEKTGDYYPFLIRHNGRYTVDTTPVVTFTDVYNFNKVYRNIRSFDPVTKSLKESLYKINISNKYDIEKSIAVYNKFNRLGVAFNVGFINDGGEHDSNWGVIKNHFYHKVNEINTLGVTKLSESSEYLPQYPLIGETAIDKRSIDVFKSSWEAGYYIRSGASGTSTLLPGTISTLEEKSYLGSTMVKYKPLYELFSFTQKKVATEPELESILKDNSSSTDIVWFEDDNTILIDFYMTNLISKKIGEDGLRTTMTKFVEPIDSAGDKTTIEDDINLYVRNNIVDVYSVDSIKLFVREYKGLPSEIDNVINLDNIDNGYAEETDFTYQLHGQKPLNFRLIYNKKLGYSYSIRPLIKIEA